MNRYNNNNNNNNKYRPPHRYRNINRDRDTHSKEFTLDNSLFPSLSTHLDISDNYKKDVSRDYKEIINTYDNNDNGPNDNESQIDPPTTNTNTNTNTITNTNTKMKKGWSYIDKKTRIITTTTRTPTRTPTKTNPRKQEQKDFHKCYKIMSKRWNKYRDTLNNLVGDLSPYYHYKEELRKLINEENYILSQIYHKDFYLSDEEHDEIDDTPYQY